MDIVYWAVIITCSIASVYYIIKLNDENLFGKRSEINGKILSLKREHDALEKLLGSNIQTIGAANLKIRALEDQLICATGKMDKTLENASRELDSLQDHCLRLREGQISIKEQLASKRPIVKISQPIPVTITAGPQPTVPSKQLLKKIKNQLDEVSK